MSFGIAVAEVSPGRQNADVGEESDEKLKSVQISQSADRGMEGYCKPRRKIKRSTISDILIWFLKQPGPVQTSILGIEDGMQASYADVIRRIADELDQLEEPPRKYSVGSNFSDGSPDEDEPESPPEPPAKPRARRPKG